MGNRQTKSKRKDPIERIEQRETKKLMANFKIKEKFFCIDYQDLEVLNSIGKGAFSTVFAAIWRGGGDIKVAFKLFDTRNLFDSKDDFGFFEKEVSIIGSLSHPNILIFFGVSLKPPRIGIITEYCENGNIREYLETHKNFLLLKKLQILCGIANGMFYLHQNNILHRDLKPENVLFTKNLTPKIIDFGLSREHLCKDEKKTTRIGTSYYIAPEVTLGEHYGKQIDVFSYGIMFFEVILSDFKETFTRSNGKPIQHTFRLENRIARNPNFRPDVNRLDQFLPKNAIWIKEYLGRLWNHDPLKRPTFQEIYKELHAFVQKIRKTVYFKPITSSHTKSKSKPGGTNAKTESIPSPEFVGETTRECELFGRRNSIKSGAEAFKMMKQWGSDLESSNFFADQILKQEIRESSIFGLKNKKNSKKEKKKRRKTIKIQREMKEKERKLNQNQQNEENKKENDELQMNSPATPSEERIREKKSFEEWMKRISMKPKPPIHENNRFKNEEERKRKKKKKFSFISIKKKGKKKPSLKEIKRKSVSSSQLLKLNQQLQPEEDKMKLNVMESKKKMHEELKRIRRPKNKTKRNRKFSVTPRKPRRIPITPSKSKRNGSFKRIVVRQSQFFRASKDLTKIQKHISMEIATKKAQERNDRIIRRKKRRLRNIKSQRDPNYKFTPPSQRNKREYYRPIPRDRPKTRLFDRKKLERDIKLGKFSSSLRQKTRIQNIQKTVIPRPN